MIKTKQALSEIEKEDLKIRYHSAQANKWVGLILTGCLAYLSYLLIRLVYDEIRTNRYSIKDAEIIDLGLVVLIFGALAIFTVWITIFAFRWMFLAYRNKAILFEKDKIHSKKEVIRGRLVGVGGRRQGFSFKFDNGEEVPVDFSYLITGGYRIIDSAILTNAEVEITRLPHSLLCYGVRYIHLPEQKQELMQGTQKQVTVSGTITFAFIFEVGLKAKYKGIIKLDRPQMIIQIGNYPIKLAVTELPIPGSYTKQIVQEYMEIEL